MNDSGFKVLLGVVLIFFIVVFGYQYAVLAIGSTAQGVNTTNSPYAAEINASQQTSQASLGILSISPYFIALAALIAGILIIFWVAKTKTGY